MIQCGRYRPFEDSLVLSAEAFARTSAIAATTAVTTAFRMVEERAATRFRDPTLTRLTRPSFRPFLSSYKNSYMYMIFFTWRVLRYWQRSMTLVWITNSN